MGKQYLDLQPRVWKLVYKFYLEHASSLSNEDLLLTLITFVEQFSFTKEEATSIVTSLLPTFNAISSTQELEADQQEAYLTVVDIERLKERLLHEPSSEVRRLLVSLVVYARVNPHPSHWIKYEPNVISFLSSLQKLKVSERNLLTMRLHNIYNLNMQVVGSNQPIPCYNIPWLYDNPSLPEPSLDPSSENPLVAIGPLTPETIKLFVGQLPYKD